MHVTTESAALAHSVHELHQQVVNAEILLPGNEREVTIINVEYTYAGWKSEFDEAIEQLLFYKISSTLHHALEWQFPSV